MPHRDDEFREFVLASAGRLQRTAFLLCGDRTLAALLTLQRFSHSSPE